MRGNVTIMLKEDVLDVQGQAVQQSLRALGFNSIGKLRIGKVIEVAIEASSREEALNLLQDMCEKLLANPVIEDYRIKLEES